MCLKQLNNFTVIDDFSSFDQVKSGYWIHSFYAQKLLRLYYSIYESELRKNVKSEKHLFAHDYSLRFHYRLFDGTQKNE